MLSIGILFVFAATAFSALISSVAAHAFLNVPLGRASVWRRYPIPKNRTNFDDDALSCGGFRTMLEHQHGKCGPCGDIWSQKVPRDHENGGRYDNNIVTAKYVSGSVIDIAVNITANHLGTVQYSLCRLTSADQPETEECFRNLPLADGTCRYPIESDVEFVRNEVQLPKSLPYCDHCVFRLKYRTGVHQGNCSDGTVQKGCGPQGFYMACADIRIVPKN